MSAGNTYLAVFVGSPSSPRWTAWNALSEAERKAKQSEGIAAWQSWVAKHKDVIVELGGPLGKTMGVSANGVHPTSNHMGAFTIVRAESHEAAAKLFEEHPHFTILPGEAVEVMPVIAIPAG
jgi:hypothetical protein